MESINLVMLGSIKEDGGTRGRGMYFYFVKGLYENKNLSAGFKANYFLKKKYFFINELNFTGMFILNDV